MYIEKVQKPTSFSGCLQRTIKRLTIVLLSFDDLLKLKSVEIKRNLRFH